MKRPTDTAAQHAEKVDRKRQELKRRGFSEARITQYLKDWSGFDPRTNNKRMNDAQSATDRRL